MDAKWTDADSGGTSVLATVDPSGGQGPDGDSKYMRLYDATPNTNRYAKRTRTVSEIGQKYTLEFALYMAKGGFVPWNTHSTMTLYNGFARFVLVFTCYGILYHDGSGYQVIQSRSRSMIGSWQTYKISVDTSNPNNSNFSIAVNGSNLGTWAFARADTTNAGLLEIFAGTGHSDPTNYGTSDIYLDNIKISGTGDDAGKGNVGKDKLSTYRYAVSYARSGNYGAESNPLKSLVGTPVFTGAGLNDMTVHSSSEYTGDENISIIVKIDGTGTPDTVEISYDGGETWATSTFAISSVIYLHYGIVIEFGATTGHTDDNYWTIACSACSAVASEEKVSLTSIPTSSDPQVDQRRLYRTVAGGSRYYWLATINDNTSTTFTDNIPDIQLGALMEEDHDLCPGGRFSVWWDDRLWVFEGDTGYYSQIAYPEHFDTTFRYVTIARGDRNDEIMGAVGYKDALYVFRKKSIYAIQKTSTAYGVYLLDNDAGCSAPWSIVEANNLLYFLSDRGIEVYNGVDTYPLEMSLPIGRTIASIDRSASDFITGEHNKNYREIWWSVPDLSKVIVYNYLANKWWFFTFPENPSILAAGYNSADDLVLKYGTPAGKVFLCDSGYLDGTTAITSTYLKGWYGDTDYSDVVKLEAEYEIPNGKTLVAKVYVNLNLATAERTANLTGANIGTTDVELRRPIWDGVELGQRGKHFALEFTNAENVGGDLKLNNIIVKYNPRREHQKVYGSE